QLADRVPEGSRQSPLPEAAEAEEAVAHGVQHHGTAAEDRMLRVHGARRRLPGPEGGGQIERVEPRAGKGAHEQAMAAGVMDGPGEPAGKDGRLTCALDPAPGRGLGE